MSHLISKCQSLKAFVFQTRESTLPVSHGDDSELSDGSSPEEDKKSKQQVRHIFPMFCVFLWCQAYHLKKISMAIIN